MSEGVTEQAVGGICILTMDTSISPELTAPVRAALIGALDRAEGAGKFRAVVLAARGRGYPGSAEDDGSDFPEERRAPDGAALTARVESMAMPVFAAMHGTVTGLGLELALAAHYRITDRHTRLGFPDLSSGVLPVAGGIQRLCRVVGPQAALDILLSGTLTDAADALDLGLVDRVAEAPLPKATVEFVRDTLAQGGGPRPTGGQDAHLSARKVLLETVSARRAESKPEPGGPEARVFECVEAAILLPFAAALGTEQAASEDLWASDTSRALRHLGRAERAARHPPVAEPVTPRSIARIGVVGTGQIGRGMTAAALAAGMSVTLVARTIEKLETAVEQIIDGLDREIARRRIDEATREARLARLSGTVDMAAVGSADIVVEAVREDADEKRRVFGALDTLMRRGALLATTTATLDIDGLAAGTSRPEDILGFSLFPPVTLSPVIEMVAAIDTSDQALATAWEFAHRLGKVAVPATVSDGYVIRRVLGAARGAAELSLLDGASVGQVDTMLKEFGMPLGLFETWDIEGLGTPWARAHEVTDLPGRLRHAGRTARNAGRGWYDYVPGEARGVPSPEVADIVSAARRDHGVTPEDQDAGTLRRRIMAAMANAGAELVADGVALRPSDVDLGAVLAGRLPRKSGGPMMAADLAGLLLIRRDLDAFRATSSNPDFWTPHPLIAALVKNGLIFDDLNRDPDRVHDLL